MKTSQNLRLLTSTHPILSRWNPLRSSRADVGPSQRARGLPTMQSPTSSWPFTGRACLLQHGCYSVLDIQHGSCFCYSHAAFFFLLSSCCATGLRRPRPMCHAAYDCEGRPFCCCTQTKPTKIIIILISLYQDAGRFGSDMFTTLFPCRGGGALRWSMDI